MHIHLGFVPLFTAFVGSVLLVGTLWRVVSFILAGADNQILNDIGAAMAFMY